MYNNLSLIEVFKNIFITTFYSLWKSNVEFIKIDMVEYILFLSF